MTYIWNRANKVPQELKPDRITESFRKWENKLQGEYKNSTCEKRKKKISDTLRRQTIFYEDSIRLKKKS